MNLSQELAQQLFNYDADTGALNWKISKSNRAPIGAKAGCLNADGYLVAQINNCLMYCHQIVWVFHFGEWPTKEIDHINGNKNDNRITNLRLVSSRQNSFNARISLRNTSGVKNVRWDAERKKWEVSIKAGAVRYRRRFDDIELAELVAREVRSLLHKDFARHA